MATEEDFLPLPPPKKASKPKNNTGDSLPEPPLKKYGYLYYWHKFLNFFRY